MGLVFDLSPYLPSATMAFTCSDICKVRPPFDRRSLLQSPLISNADHVRSVSRRGRDNVSLILVASFAVILPPLGVFLEKGCGADLCINILLVRVVVVALSRLTRLTPSFSDPSGLPVRLYYHPVFPSSLLQPPRSAPELFTVRHSQLSDRSRP